MYFSLVMLLVLLTCKVSTLQVAQAHPHQPHSKLRPFSDFRDLSTTSSPSIIIHLQTSPNLHLSCLSLAPALLRSPTRTSRPPSCSRSSRSRPWSMPARSLEYVTVSPVSSLQAPRLTLTQLESRKSTRTASMPVSQPPAPRSPPRRTPACPAAWRSTSTCGTSSAAVTCTA